jgi:phytanoyl-CoA hydroxylase
MSARETVTGERFDAESLARFRRDGYVISRALAPAAIVDRMRTVAQAQLAREAGPLEYEADLGYPGAPASRDAPGGRTVRRLLQAYARDAVFREWATSPVLASRLGQLLGAQVMLSQAHHNCIMTKHPAFASATLWHQDIRYWSFERSELVSVWLALGRERVENGCLLLLPGTHAMAFEAGRFDEAKFFRDDLEQNRGLIATRLAAELEAGDVLFFHCRLLHAAGNNRSGQTKYSVVFTYHAADNRPLAGTRSAALPEIALPAPA